MNPDHIKSIYFLGIGGIGMSALARHFHSRGVRVSGYDKTPSNITHALESDGIRVMYADDPNLVESLPGLVVYTPAIPLSSKLYGFFSTSKVPVLKRSEMLGHLSSEVPTIAVAGTHGKTTICTMLTHIMKTAGMPCLSFLGGISANYDTNYLSDSNPQWLIAEADEYDRSFLSLSPRLALISAIDSDHLDIYGDRKSLLQSFASFAEKLKGEGLLIARNGIAEELNYSGRHWSYGNKPTADYHINNVRIDNACYHADFQGKVNINSIALKHPGRHNLENALGAAALAHQAGIGQNSIRAGLNSFSGVKRRFEILVNTQHCIYVDDYAHHPEEIKACISTAREMWPGKKITGIFQPHLYSRTRDLAEEFAQSLAGLDKLILLDIYPAREEPLEGVSAHMLLDKIKIKDAIVCPKDKILKHISELRTEILITMGAGDIDRLAGPVKELLTQQR